MRKGNNFQKVMGIKTLGIIGICMLISVELLCLITVFGGGIPFLIFRFVFLVMATHILFFKHAYEILKIEERLNSQ